MLHEQRGFTLMEIIVSTTIFAGTLTLMFSLFSYTLKINRRGDALRQATQGMRNFSEFLVKEIRNGKIDYAVGSIAQVGPCPDGTAYTTPSSTVLGLTSLDGERECIFWDSVAKALKVQKETTLAYSLNPTSFTVEDLKFFVRPTTDPYTGAPPPRFQPMVTIEAIFKTQPYSGEPAVIIPYQTTVSSDVYDIPQ